MLEVCFRSPDLEFCWVGDDAVDPLEQAQTISILVGAGVKTIAEARAERYKTLSMQQSRAIQPRKPLASCYSTTVLKNVEAKVASPFFQTLKLLEQKNLHFTIIRNSSTSIVIFVTMVGKRIEIYVDEDEDINFSVFAGDESVISGQGALARELDVD